MAIEAQTLGAGYTRVDERRGMKAEAALQGGRVKHPKMKGERGILFRRRQRISDLIDDGRRSVGGDIAVSVERTDVVKDAAMVAGVMRTNTKDVERIVMERKRYAPNHWMQIRAPVWEKTIIAADVQTLPVPRSN